MITKVEASRHAVHRYVQRSTREYRHLDDCDNEVCDKCNALTAKLNEEVSNNYRNAERQLIEAVSSNIKSQNIFLKTSLRIQTWVELDNNIKALVMSNNEVGKNPVVVTVITNRFLPPKLKRNRDKQIKRFHERG